MKIKSTLICNQIRLKTIIIVIRRESNFLINHMLRSTLNCKWRTQWMPKSLLNSNIKARNKCTKWAPSWITSNTSQQPKLQTCYPQTLPTFAIHPKALQNPATVPKSQLQTCTRDKCRINQVLGTLTKTNAPNSKPNATNTGRSCFTWPWSSKTRHPRWTCTMVNRTSPLTPTLFKSSSNASALGTSSCFGRD